MVLAFAPQPYGADGMWILRDPFRMSMRGPLAPDLLQVRITAAVKPIEPVS